jgi:hypothetical protein
MNQDKVYRKVRTAIKNGVIIRPDKCERCGSLEKLGSDGRSTIQAHHHDYNKPLDIEWICAKCHRAETPLPEIIGAPSFGEGNGQSKLTEKTVAEIRVSQETNRALAKKYGVAHSTIGRAKNGTHWLAAAPKP